MCDMSITNYIQKGDNYCWQRDKVIFHPVSKQIQDEISPAFFKGSVSSKFHTKCDRIQKKSHKPP